MKKMGNRRPNTRSKNKRDRPEDNADVTSEIFMKILANEAVSDEDINQLYMLWKPVCQGCRVNTKDNPNCFCGLIPAPNGSRKSGLWQKTSEIVQSLGPDPSRDLRVSSDTPAGLTNLGATCYANSILQCLYMNKAFREGVFMVEPDVLEKEPVLNNLARLFAQLHSSKMATVDSAPFIQTLELDNGIQQDSHEFLTLLFSLLEQCLSRSKLSKARTVVQDLFRGGVSHVTRCLKCGNESEASSKIEDFYGLELNVKGLKSLDSSLDDYLSIEELKGDNQYYCDACASRADAARRIKLRSLPRVLNLQLKRYVFLPNTTTKKKITSAFSFPTELNLARRLSDTSDVEFMYDLAAVLVHKGSAVNSGHYTAHIRDNNSGDWWEFDDEQVSNLGKQPFGAASSCAAVPSKSDPVTSSSATEVGNGINGTCAEAKQLKGPNSNVSDPTQMYSSTDAYMLMYVCRPSKTGSEVAISDYNEQRMEIDGSAVSSETDIPLPSHLLKYVDVLNSQYIDSCELYKSKKEQELSCITSRRQEVRSILSEAAVLSDERPYYWISSEWLRQWADNIAPTTIDNTSIQCLHGKVPITKINSMKRVSAEAWAMLLSKYGGGPPLTNGDYCVDCIVEASRKTVHANSYRDKRSMMKELAEAALSGEPSDGKLYYVSKPWILHWVRRKNIDVPLDADSGPTAPIRCPHGNLMPELAPGAKRVVVPEDLWDFIRETAMAVKPDDPLGWSTFSSDSEPCPSCNIELTEAAVSEDYLREFKSKQRQNHEKLALGKSVALCQDAKYYLLPSSWLSKWRTYVTASGKNASSVEIDPLNTVISGLLCMKHGKLLKRPPQLTWKRELIFQKPADADGLTLITEDDWSLFCEDWGHTEAECVIARIDIENAATDDIINSDISVSDDHTNMSGGINMTLTRTPIIRTFPEVCEECIGERESSELITKLNYTNEDVCVCLIRGKEPPKSILEASNISDPCRRSSKRSRKATYGNSVNLKVSGTTSVYQLKMMIWESFGVVKENQILHKGSKVIADETACLADANIFPGDVLWVTDSKIHENRDIADELSMSNVDERKVEEGFGTLLTSSYPFQEVSEACSN